MDKPKRERLHAMGGGETTLKEFLGLSSEQEALIDIQLNLTECVRGMRLIGGVTQTELARRMGTSQSNIARLENGAAAASIDYLLRALLALGLDNSQISAAVRGDLPEPLHSRAGGEVDTGSDVGEPQHDLATKVLEASTMPSDGARSVKLQRVRKRGPSRRAVPA